MDIEKKNEIHKKMADKLKIYIDAIIEMYGSYIPNNRLNYLKNIDNYESLIKIHDYESINGYASDDGINLPLCADRVFKKINKIPGYGINKNHQSYNENTLIINNNTFVDYIIHVFISGTDTTKYFEDLLLHETMHFCGSGGASALKEGINELLTRKIALEKKLKTNGCGYPKEVKIAYELQNLFGEDIINQVAFINSPHEIYMFLEKELGPDAALLFFNVSDAMEKEFYLKYYKDIYSYNGISGILKKTINYKKIDYSNVYKLINDYKNKEMNTKRINK